MWVGFNRLVSVCLLFLTVTLSMDKVNIVLVACIFFLVELFLYASLLFSPILSMYVCSSFYSKRITMVSAGKDADE